jgi:hypothetical protein
MLPQPFLRAILLCTLLTAAAAFAQRPEGAVPRKGKVYGRVLDASTKKAAEYATVTVFAAGKDSLLGGTIVRGNGDFSVEQLPLVPLKVVVSFIGYKPQETQVTLKRDHSEHDLGNLMLEPDAELLNEVEVVGERSSVVMQVDRRVFNVEKDLSTQGGTGVDVMKNVPGLSVDVEGNVEMRGSRPMVLVDGRPTSLQLDQIPAEDIERVEVITNPSAAFDASTTGGIINVVLKKNTKPGYSGQMQAGIGTNDRYQGGFNLNAREGRWGFNLSYNYNTARNLTDGQTLRTDRSNGVSLGRFEQDTETISGRDSHGGRLGVDWQISNRNTLSFSAGVRAFDRFGDDRQDFINTDPNGELLSSGYQLNTSTMSGMSTNSQIAFRHTYPKVGKEWTADVGYNGWARNSRSAFDLNGFSVNGDPLIGSPRIQDNIGGSGYDQVNFQTDFVDPINERTKIEFGLKGQYRLDNTYIDVFVTSPEVGDYVPDSALTNNFDITDIINAAYFNWSHKLDETWSVMAGLRFEQTWFETVLRDTDQRFSYKYPNGTENLPKALFPALYLVRKWKDSTRELQVNFSRKIDRPRHWQITPFIMFADSRNVRIGNPTLAPELSNLGEVNHLLPFLKGKASWLTSVYGRYTQDVITSFASPLPSDSSILLNTFVNGSYSTNGGWENILKFDPVTGLQLTLSGTVQYTNVGLAEAQGGKRNQGFNWNAKALVNYRFAKDWAMQLNGEYEGPEILPQGVSLSQYGLDASLSHDFNKHLSAVVAVNDVFFTRRWGNLLDTPFFLQENFSRREQRNVRITFTWKFGERDASLFRRKNGQQRREPGSGAGGGENDI